MRHKTIFTAAVMISISLLGLFVMIDSFKNQRSSPEMVGTVVAPAPLPASASVIRDVGNGWTLFDLEVDGDTCTFLMDRQGRLTLVKSVEEIDTEPVKPAEPKVNIEKKE